MSIVGTDAAGLRAASRCLETGTPIIVSLPHPRAYVVVGTDAAAVNLAKARPAEQPVGIAVIDLLAVRPHVDLDEDAFQFADWLARHELLNLFVPARRDFPYWMAPSVLHGWLGITTVPAAGAGALWDGRGHLYVSSANRTGNQVARTAAAADTEFAGRLLVLDDGVPRDPHAESGSATIVRVAREGGIEMVRPGINDALFPGDRDQFLADLSRRWKTGDAQP